MPSLTTLRSKHWERIRSNLFFVPVTFAIGAGACAEVLLEADRRIDDLPDRVTSTVDSARTVLGLVAGATLTFAAIAFSVSLLLISAASSQFSPRVVHGLFRDPFNKRVMGIVVGTFVYCLFVLRAVRGPLEDAGEAVIPSLSVLVGGVLGVVAILSIVAFINHAAHSMEVSTMLDRVTREAFRSLPPTPAEGTERDEDAPEPEGEGLVVEFDDHGWIQMVDGDQILDAVQPGSTVRVDTAAGRYAIPKALSPGINDPTTAQDALFHMGVLVRELLDRRPIERVRVEDGKTLIEPELPNSDDIVELAFDEVRLAALTRQAALVAEIGERSDLPAADHRRVSRAFESRFG